MICSGGPSREVIGRYAVAVVGMDMDVDVDVGGTSICFRKL